MLATASAWLLAFCRLRRSTVESPSSFTAGTKRGGLDAGSRVSTNELRAAWCRPEDAEAPHPHDTAGVAWPCQCRHGPQQVHSVPHVANTHWSALSRCWCLVSVRGPSSNTAVSAICRGTLAALGRPVPSCQALHEQATDRVCITTLQLLQPFLHHVGRPEISSELFIASCSSRGGPRSADRGHTRARLPY